ncbi:MAG: DUF3604 domain-containing protein [Pseudomonadota bacterium]
MTIKKSPLAFALAGIVSISTFAQHDGGAVPPEVIDSVYPGSTYSPYARRGFPSNVYWGDTHLHTSLSLDAGLFGNTLDHDDAYRFALGEEVISSTGLPLRLSRPLDWLVVTDHSDMMGLATGVQEGAPQVLAVDKGREWHEAFKKGGQAAGEAAFDLIQLFSQFKLPEDIVVAYSPGSANYGDLWEMIIDKAEEYNDPGHFTAFIGYEWTSVPQGNNLHRNVILRDGKRRAIQSIPLVTQPPVGTTDPLKLYEWLEDYEERTGGNALAIAHNGNLSNGWMFPMEKTYAGGRVNKEYVEKRARWEPLYEVTQIKGDGETHPYLSPNDEFAGYFIWDVGNLDISELKTDDMLAGEYAREALKNGMKLENKFGTNPYKFGMVGATDSHTSLSTAEEENYFGKAVSAEPSKNRVQHPFIANDLGAIEGYKLAASGWQGVWATENTRAAIFDAMERKDTYATTGPRMIVRFFGGWDYTDDDLRSRTPAFQGYAKGVPMGSDLQSAPEGGSPTFMLVALRDPIGANLDRVQVVKGWVDSRGKTHERVYDVAWSGDRMPGDDGKLPPVGNTVDLEAANYVNTIGASELATIWKDPDFDPRQKAFYYARVLEIPTPTWILYDVVRLGAEAPPEAALVHQERAYTSPIWYTP